MTANGAHLSCVKEARHIESCALPVATGLVVQMVQMSPDDLATPTQTSTCTHWPLGITAKVNVAPVWLPCCSWQPGCHVELLGQ